MSCDDELFELCLRGNRQKQLCGPQLFKQVNTKLNFPQTVLVFGGDTQAQGG